MFILVSYSHLAVRIVHGIFLIQIPCVYSFFQTVPNGLIQIKHTNGTIIHWLFLKFRTLQAYRHLQSNFWNCTFMNISYRICLLHCADNGYANTLCTCLLHIGLVQTPGFGYILVLICYRYAITIIKLLTIYTKHVFQLTTISYNMY